MPKYAVMIASKHGKTIAERMCVSVCVCVRTLVHTCMVACVSSNVIVSSHNFIVVLFLSLKNTSMFCINLSSSNNVMSVGDVKCQVFEVLILSWKGRKMLLFFLFPVRTIMKW